MENPGAKSTNPDAEKEEVMRGRVVEMRNLLDLVVHVSTCENAHSFNCVNRKCRKLMLLIHHVAKCETRSSGGCMLCKKLWFLLKCHAQVCKQSQSLCPVPHCRNIKEYLKVEDVSTSWRSEVMEHIIEEDNAAPVEVSTSAPDAHSSTNA
ncbi:histone acetyltransferase HAC1-like [Senna tora]|uniref:histone acetyltransferase n=1 Tax=Senna tora TaxID=362788 RepID=A0A834WQ75_9FABA|nr:histone acetyltransferase HAC1-like [Senna tora]